MAGMAGRFVHHGDKRRDRNHDQPDRGLMRAGWVSGADIENGYSTRAENRG